MSRRVIAALAAIVLAVIAALLVIQYVANADQRAMTGMEPIPVVVAEETIPPGTPAEELSDYVTVREIPATAVAPGAVESLEDIQGQLAAVQIYPGEELLAARFASPEELEDADRVDVPEGFHEISIQLSTNRVIGGRVTPGDTVGFFVNDTDNKRTHLVLHKVLVTAVQGGVTITEEEDGTETTQPAADTVMVTLAVPAPDAEIVSHAAEFNGIWLSLEPLKAPEDGTREVTDEVMFP